VSLGGDEVMPEATLFRVRSMSDTIVQPGA
jgi:hypothetical protein